MRKLCLFLLVLVMLFVSCKTTETESNAKVAAVATEQTQTAEPAVEEKAETPSKGYLTFDPLKGFVPGVLYQLNLAEGQEPVVKAVALAGNRAGVEINKREPSIENIRFVFEQNEWVEVVVSSEMKDNLMVFAVPHNSDPAIYDEKYFQAIPDNMQYVGLSAPEDPNESWGSFYLNPDFNNTGFYDLVFTDGISPVAMVLVRFYDDGSISDISDEELEKFMSQTAEDAKKL